MCSIMLFSLVSDNFFVLFIIQFRSPMLSYCRAIL